MSAKKLLVSCFRISCEFCFYIHNFINKSCLCIYVHIYPHNCNEMQCINAAIKSLDPKVEFKNKCIQMVGQKTHTCICEYMFIRVSVISQVDDVLANAARRFSYCLKDLAQQHIAIKTMPKL